MRIIDVFSRSRQKYRFAMVVASFEPGKVGVQDVAPHSAVR
jgi:hypothetical protein